MTPLEWFKLIAPLVTGGVMGALVTAIITNSRNKIQSVSKRLSVSSIDIPAIMPGYDSRINLREAATGESYDFKKISTVQLELSNTGNKGFDEFEVGINLPDNANIIGVQYTSSDRYHILTYSPTVGIDNTFSYLDISLKPFHRTDTYTITLVVVYPEDNLVDNVQLSKKESIKFVDAALIDRELAELIKDSAKSFPFSSFYLLPIIVGARLLKRKFIK